MSSLTLDNKLLKVKKLSQEKILRQETESKFNLEIKASEQDIQQMNIEREKKENSYKIEMTELRGHLADMEKLLCSTKLENEELKESCKAFQVRTTDLAEEMFGLKISIEQERKSHQEEMNTFKNQLEMITLLTQERETTLQQTLAQEKILRQETETQLNSVNKAFEDINMEREKKRISHKAEVTKSS
ncbi:hypothetical protein SKAU_G00232230 [Synaphobranchus kaupii]|uniref:Uncharacterized protein n=1 Tax=Synaphobranchus kaupii TaxID=118154 RepID=A0A9Q1IT33_SYNKA|nr:hypothetical protein SKAU_G00232230 [Synaphobranchus kaupii]